MDVDEDAVVIAFDWKNPAVNDMDLFVSSPAGSIIEASETGSRYEGDYFDNDNDAIILQLMEFTCLVYLLLKRQLMCQQRCSLLILKQGL